VEFITSDEAQRAMERHRQNIGSRYIELFRATKRCVLRPYLDTFVSLTHLKAVLFILDWAEYEISLLTVY